MLKPMMSANIDIVTHLVKDTIYTSRAGIRRDDKGKYTMVLKNEQPKKIRVTTGIRNPIHVQILSGLNSDEEVILGDWEKVLEESKDKKSSSLKKILWMIRSK